jgi:ATP-dependent Clp protease ATP-binding subunit ClpA
MRLDKLAEKAQEALEEAAELAAARGQQSIEPEHLLPALIRQTEGVARTLLEGKFSEADTVEADVTGGELSFAKANVAAIVS